VTLERSSTSDDLDLQMTEEPMKEQIAANGEFI